jgi:hypothetical protein
MAALVVRFRPFGHRRGRIRRACRRRGRDRRRDIDHLDHALSELRTRRAAEDKPFTRDDLRQAIMLGAVERARPKMITVIAITTGLLPIMWSTGTDSEVMQRIAVPAIGGMVSSTVLMLIVIPAVYGLIKGWALPRSRGAIVEVAGVEKASIARGDFGC